MAGSFGIFRQYEKVALAGLAIMAMLAFFVLPPILQMGAGAGGADPLAVSWTGGGLRESGLQRAVIMRKVMNQFLVETMAAAGQDPSRMRLADDEKDVVDTILLAKEAEANGIVVSNSAINQFLSEWTNDLVRPDQFDEIVSRIGGRMGISQQDVFEALRTVLMARRMETLLLGGVGFEGTTPGMRWDYYRRLEQGATIEAVPVVVETFIDKLPEPSEAALRSFYETYKDELPEARSAEPGFRQPHRARYDYLVAKAGVFREEEEKKITTDQIKAFYEERKAALYKAKPAEPAAEKPAPDAAASGETKNEPKTAAAESAPQTPAKTAEPAPADKGTEKPTEKPAGASVSRGSMRQVAFRQPTAEGAKPEAKPEETKPAASAPAGEAAAKPAEEKPADQKPAAAEFEPLDKVQDDIRKRLTDEAVDKRITAIFDAAKTDVARYGESLALWQVAGDGAGPAPVGPDVKKMAEVQGLEGGRSDLVNATQAFAAGGIGGSFEFALSREFGMRQQRWIDMIFGPGAPMLQAVTSRDVEGNRYLSWKTEDQPEFTPSFQSAREDVLRAWRIVEARPLARKAAEEIAAEAGSAKTLEDVAKARGSLEVEKVGPFTWLTRGTAPFGSAPVLSQPDGLAMPGEEIMKTVFALEPGRTAVAFNEPKTVCYVVRLTALEPEQSQLEELFLAASQDPRRLATVAEDDTREVYNRWMKAIEERHAVSWKREPGGPELR
ncbi:MAG: hypothetical protein K8S94_03415 [Planctomycetia bacterium]|nr:hypothetical protein [Planctomycetia bacterium]